MEIGPSPGWRAHAVQKALSRAPRVRPRMVHHLLKAHQPKIQHSNMIRRAHICPACHRPFQPKLIVHGPVRQRIVDLMLTALTASRATRLSRRCTLTTSTAARSIRTQCRCLSNTRMRSGRAGLLHLAGVAWAWRTLSLDKARKPGSWHMMPFHNDAAQHVSNRSITRPIRPCAPLILGARTNSISAPLW
jgi:hypothetical protein